MTLLLLELVISLVFVVLGANYLINGASSIAKKTGLSEFLIGALIVGFGTSCPELVVSVTGALEGNSDIALGNVIGSNIFNTLLILGLTAVLFPITITKDNKRNDIPWILGLTLLFMVLGVFIVPGISLVEGIIFLLVFSVYLFFLFRNNGKKEDSGESEIKEYKTLTSIGFIVGGLLGLILGGKYFVDSAVSIARIIGVSDKFIAITVLAVGTSLPEFATCVIAALKKKPQMALGDIIGSNIFNMILILGVSACIHHPLSFSGISVVDLIALGVSSIVFVMSYMRKESKFYRTEGIIMLSLFGLYYWHLFTTL